MLQCYYSKHLFWFWGHFCAWIYNDVSLLFVFDLFLGWGRERWSWEQTICNIFMDLLRKFFSNSKGSYQKGILMSLLWLPPTRFVHGFLCCFSYKAGNLICGRNSSPTCHYCVEIWAAEVFSIIKIVLEKRIFESYNMINLYHHIQAMDQIWVINYLTYRKIVLVYSGKKRR